MTLDRVQVQPGLSMVSLDDRSGRRLASMHLRHALVDTIAALGRMGWKEVRGTASAIGGPAAARTPRQHRRPCITEPGEAGLRVIAPACQQTRPSAPQYLRPRGANA
jgi:hypothetical protein